MVAIVCSGTFGRKVPIREKAEAASRAGFDGISVYTDEHDPGLASRLGDLGLHVAEVDGAMAWRPGQPGIEVERAVEIATELHARSITVLETTGDAPDPAEAAEHFARVCALAAANGLDVDIEPYAWSGIGTIADAAAIVRLAGHTNGGIMLDVWHLFRGPDRGNLDPAHLDLVHAVQVSDPVPDGQRQPVSLRDECMHDRRLPGERSARVTELLPAVPLEVEVFGLTGTPEAIAVTAYEALELLRTRGPRGGRRPD
jgi:sugar phosphate isomerase/epimerase